MPGRSERRPGGRCVPDVAYDPQCEGDRSEYLVRLIAAIGRQAAFFGAVSARLERAAADDGDSDIGLAFAVLRRLAQARDDLALSRLRQVFERMSAEHQLACMDDLVCLFGLPALVECAERLAGDLEGEGWRGASLVDALRERDGPGADEALRAAKAASKPLARLLASVAHLEEAAPRKPPNSLVIRARLKRGERAGGVRPMALSDAEWRGLGEDFIEVENPRKALPYLRLFARRAFPGKADAILPWLATDDSRIKSAAVRALGRLHDDHIRGLALQRLAAGDPSGAWLLRANYQPGDMVRLVPLLDAAADDHEAHDLGFAILDLVKEHDIPAQECRDLLLRLYERTPCSLCRHDAAAALDARGEVPKWMADECLFDADPATVRLAERLAV